MTALCSKGCGRKATRRGWCNSHYMQQRERQIAYGRWEVVYVDAEPVRLHIRALQAAGLGSRRIAELAGVNRKTIQWITTGRSERGAGPANKVTAVNAKKILAVSLPATPHQAASDHQPVPAVGTVRRMQALVRFGYTHSYLAERLGITPANATHLFRGDTRHVLADTARKVERLFGELEVTPGPSERARNEGRRRRWPLPFAWDEDSIDDPAAAPVRADSVDRKDAEAITERQARVAELTRAGYSARQIADRLRVADRTVTRDRAAIGIVAESLGVA